MRLVLIITDYGSFNNFLSELAVTMLQSGMELHVICSRERVIAIGDKNEFASQNIRFHFVDIPRKISISAELKAAKAIRKIIDTVEPDLVHIHFTTSAFPALIFKNRAIPYWGTFHGLGMNSSSGIKKVIFTFVEIFSFTRLQKIFTVNEKDTSLAEFFFKQRVQKYMCFGFGCDINQFNRNRFVHVRQEEARSYGIASDDFVIAYTGRFVSFKGFHLVVKAFESLRRLFPGKVKLVLIGGNDKIHSTGLDERESEFLLTSTDIIRVGYTKDVAKFLAFSDIFLFPSLKEGLPTCILEALSMGIPIITFDARGNNDVVVNNRNGLLLKPAKSVATNVENIVDALKHLMLNPEEYKRLMRIALIKREDYSRQRFVDEQLLYYENFRDKMLCNRC